MSAGSGSPVTSIPLGAELLTLIGDVQGAAKALSAEFKDAQREAKKADVDLRNIEKTRKQLERDISKMESKGKSVSPELRQQLDRLRGQEAEATKRSIDLAIARDRKALRADTAKEDAKNKRDNRKEIDARLGGFEKRIAGRFYQAEDSLRSVAQLIASRGGGSSLSQAVASGVGRAGSAIGATGSALSSALAVAGPGIAGAGIALSGAAIYANFQQKRTEEARLQEQNSQRVFDFARQVSFGQAAPSVLRNFGEEQAKAQERAVGILANRYGRSAGARTGVFGNIATLFGIGAQREKLVGRLMQEQLERSGVVNTFGEKFAKSIDSQTLQNNDQIQKIVDRRLAGELFSLGNTVRGLTEVFIQNKTISGYVQQQLGISNVKEARLEEAERQRTGARASALEQRSQEALLREIRRPNDVANAKIQAQWFQNLEAERVRRIQDPQPF